MGFVRVGVAEADRRRRVLELLPAGRAALAAAVPVWEREHAALEAKLGDADRLRGDLVALG